MHFGFSVIKATRHIHICISNGQMIVTVNQLPSAGLLVVRLNTVELTAIQLITTRLSGYGVRQLQVITINLTVFQRRAGLCTDITTPVFTMRRERAHGIGGVYTPCAITITLPFLTAGNGWAIAVLRVFCSAAHSHSRTNTAIEVFSATLCIVHTKMQHITGFSHGCDDCTHVVSVVIATVIIFIVFSAVNTCGAIKHAASAAHLDTHTILLIVHPLARIVNNRALNGTNPFRTGGFF